MAEDKNKSNPYRFGVLEGNHVEDRFSLDLVGNQVKKVNKPRAHVPSSTMKDDYRWYNTMLFNQRDTILSQNPDLEPQVYHNKTLKPFLEKPAHMAKREALIQQAAFTDRQQQSLNDRQSHPQQAASLDVRNPQGMLRSLRQKPQSERTNSYRRFQKRRNSRESQCCLQREKQFLAVWRLGGQ